MSIFFIFPDKNKHIHYKIVTLIHYTKQKYALRLRLVIFRKKQ